LICSINIYSLLFDLKLLENQQISTPRRLLRRRHPDGFVIPQEKKQTGRGRSSSMPDPPKLRHKRTKSDMYIDDEVISPPSSSSSPVVDLTANNNNNRDSVSNNNNNTSKYTIPSTTKLPEFISITVDGVKINVSKDSLLLFPVNQFIAEMGKKHDNKNNLKKQIAQLQQAERDNAIDCAALRAYVDQLEVRIKEKNEVIAVLQKNNEHFQKFFYQEKSVPTNPEEITKDLEKHLEALGDPPNN
jgi:hypothetical protein